MDIVIVLDGSNSIYPWEPMTAFIQKLIPTLDIGPQTTQVRAARGSQMSRVDLLGPLFCVPLQVSIIQYAVDPKFEFRLNEFRNKEDMLKAASRITQMFGQSTNTFQAIQYARWVLLRHSLGPGLVCFLIRRLIPTSACLLPSVSGASTGAAAVARRPPKSWWSSPTGNLTTSRSGNRSSPSATRKASPDSA